MNPESPLVPTLTTAQFDDRIPDAPLPVLVEFRADWCTPCRTMRSVVQAFAERNAGRAEAVRVDVDDATELVERYDISTVPTLVLFDHGRIAARIVGSTDVENLGVLLDELGSR